jgi:PKD repeat protein
LDCDVKIRHIELPSGAFSTNLYYPNYRLGPIDGGSCDTAGIDNRPMAHFRWDFVDTLHPLSVVFTDASSYLPTAWHWDFGDGSSSQEVNPNHLYNQQGTYNVCLIVSNAYAADTICRTVQVGAVSAVSDWSQPMSITVLPNPFMDHLSIIVNQPLDAPASWTLTDTWGRSVRAVALSPSADRLDLDMQGIVPGLYFWSLRKEGRSVASGKVIKM